MPKAGFKVVTVRETAYDSARRIAEDDGKSITDVVSEAIEAYRESRRQLHRQVLEILNLLKRRQGSRIAVAPSSD
jgi:hypothetical protein